MTIPVRLTVSKIGGGQWSEWSGHNEIEDYLIVTRLTCNLGLYIAYLVRLWAYFKIVRFG